MGKKYVIDESTLSGIADSIRAKKGTTADIDPENMPTEIASIEGGSNPVIQPLSVVKNGTYTAPNGVDGYSPVSVNVPIPDGYIKPSGTLDITKNGSYSVTEKASVNVSVPTPSPKTQEKTVTPSLSQQSVTPDSGYDGLSKVTVNAMPAATQATPSITVSSGGLITASATQTAGYVASGTTSATKQLTTQAAKTVTPTKSAQTAAASGVYTTGAITVAAIPSNYVDTTDATAGALDIAAGKSAYVNGVKVNGSAADCRNQKLLVSPVNDPVEVYEEEWSENALEVYNDDIDTIINDKTAIRINCRDIANGIGLTPDKIVSGNTVLGVVGTGSGGGGGTEDLNDVLTEQEALIAELKEVLAEKASGGGDGDIASSILDRTVATFESYTTTKIGEYALRTCAKLKSINVPNATSIGQYAFAGCSLLASVNFPKVESVGQYAFNQCNQLRYINLPSLASASSNAFRDTQYVETIDCGTEFASIPATMFYGCRGLKALILRSETLVTLANTSAFTSCYRILGTKNSGFNPNGEKIGFIYVPKNLLEQYASATNWSDEDLVTQFRAIEDYPEITGGN